jgi:hypothetical protein
VGTPLNANPSKWPNETYFRRFFPSLFFMVFFHRSIGVSLSAEMFDWLQRGPDDVVAVHRQAISIHICSDLLPPSGCNLRLRRRAQNTLFKTYCRAAR